MRLITQSTALFRQSIQLYFTSFVSTNKETFQCSEPVTLSTLSYWVI